MAFSDASHVSRIAFFSAIFAVFFDIIGFTTPFWIVDSNGNQGLFKNCGPDSCVDIHSWGGVMNAARALNIIGFLVGVGSLLVVIIYVVAKNDMKLLPVAGLVSSFIAGLLVIVGSTVYAVKWKIMTYPKPPPVNWSFALTVIGGILYVLEGILLVLDLVLAR